MPPADDPPSDDRPDYAAQLNALERQYNQLSAAFDALECDLKRLQGVDVDNTDD